MKRISWHVAPRYTAGSPAMVDTSTALMVAAQEREHHGFIEHTGQKDTGFQGIVFSVTHRAKFVLVEDFMTGERFSVPTRSTRMKPMSWGHYGEHGNRWDALPSEVRAQFQLR